MIIIIAMLVVVIVNWKKVPGGLQNVIESLTTFIEDYIIDIIGPKGLPYFPLVITVLFFVSIGSYVGLIPGIKAPTSDLSTTAAWAVIVFVFYEIVGIRRHGFKYFKRFLGPIPIMAPMMFVMEIISELARPFSLAIRLFANIMGGEMIIGLLSTVCVIGLPVIWMLWDSTITVLIQSFIFSLLTMVYLGGALAADDEH
jgi:F-type H+-transporting ATPase subunit a